MRILFIFCRTKPYDSQTVRQLPCGGTEKAVIFLGEAFQKLGHEVEWITTPEQLKQGPKQKPDVVITQIAELLEQFPDAQKIWWTHHFSDQPVIKVNAAFARCFADRVVTLSRCHSDDFKANLRMDSATIGHGVWFDELDTTTPKDPYRLIYASTPFRGLEKIPKLFKEIKSIEPRATIAICSSMGTYGEPEKDAQYQKIFDELKEIPGVELKGALNQAQLYAEYARASIFFYPSIWPETYCLALDEAKAHNCEPFVTNLGALSERFLGVLSSKDWLDYVLHAFSCELPYLRGTLSERGLISWIAVAKQWEEEVLG